MKPSEVLRAAKALIDTPEKWHQGSLAATSPHRTKAGPLHSDDPRRTWSRSPVARCFCVVGAIERAVTDSYDTRGVLLHLQPEVGVWPARWNDAPERTHDDVMSAFDRAIALAEANGE